MCCHRSRAVIVVAVAVAVVVHSAVFKDELPDHEFVETIVLAFSKECCVFRRSAQGALTRIDALGAVGFCTSGARNLLITL